STACKVSFQLTSYSSPISLQVIHSIAQAPGISWHADCYAPFRALWGRRSRVDEFDRLVIDTARDIIAADAACPGSEESANLKMAQEILAGIGLPTGEDRRNGGSIGLAPARTQRSTEAPVLYCAEKQRLLEAFTASVQEMMALQQQQIVALMRGDQD